MLQLTILESVVSSSIKRNMENSEYETILNYMARGEYPAGTTKEQKKAIRRKVAARSTTSNNTNSVKFVVKDGVLYFVDITYSGSTFDILWALSCLCTNVLTKNLA